jgi:hypothetical protein
VSVCVCVGRVAVCLLTTVGVVGFSRDSLSGREPLKKFTLFCFVLSRSERGQDQSAPAQTKRESVRYESTLFFVCVLSLVLSSPTKKE